MFLECLKIIDYFIIFVEFFKTFGRYFWILKYSSHVRDICINLKYEKNREYCVTLLDTVFIYLYVEFLNDFKSIKYSFVIQIILTFSYNILYISYPNLYQTWYDTLSRVSILIPRKNLLPQ